MFVVGSDRKILIQKFLGFYVLCIAGNLNQKVFCAENQIFHLVGHVISLARLWLAESKLPARPKSVQRRECQMKICLDS